MELKGDLKQCLSQNSFATVRPSQLSAEQGMVNQK